MNRKKLTVHHRRESKLVIPMTLIYLALYGLCYFGCLYAFLTESILIFGPTLFLLQFSILMLAQLYPVGFSKILRVFTFGSGSECVETYDTAPLKKTS